MRRCLIVANQTLMGEQLLAEVLLRKMNDDCEFHVVYQKVSQFAAIELSAIYHDAVKDRLYTDPANSLRRRSTQTALYRMVVDLCKLLAPILAFTTDEAWEFVPARPAESVHELTWQPQGLERSTEEAEAWQRLFKLREQALPELEAARRGKSIGKSLEAQVEIEAAPDLIATLKPDAASLQELLNVSGLELVARSGPPHRGNNDTTELRVSHARGEKCERCWHWETDIGSHLDHPTICGRCVKAIEENAKR